MYKSGAKQYQSVNTTSEVLDADPHRLIQLLMEGALTRMAQAKGSIQRGDFAEKSRLLSRVNDIMQTLQSSLDHTQGGVLAANLDGLYDYMIRRTLEAGNRNDLDMIDEVMGLLLQVKTGWDGIRQDYLQSVHGVSSSSNSNHNPEEVRLSGNVSA
ncbi:MAG: flagellar export chaperone FliS [Oleibacter sp.]|nr:flagellar export chaperone FliS [Thalassolituus sp.]